MKDDRGEGRGAGGDIYYSDLCTQNVSLATGFVDGYCTDHIAVNGSESKSRYDEILHTSSIDEVNMVRAVTGQSPLCTSPVHYFKW